MKYTVERQGPLEIHRIELHEVEQALARPELKPSVYNPLIEQTAIAPRLFALAMLANIIELNSKPKASNGSVSKN